MRKLAVDSLLLQILRRDFDGDYIGCALSPVAVAHFHLLHRNIFNQQWLAIIGCGFEGCSGGWDSVGRGSAIIKIS
jgi:hypothetical protein